MRQCVSLAASSNSVEEFLSALQARNTDLFDELAQVHTLLQISLSIYLSFDLLLSSSLHGNQS